MKPPVESQRAINDTWQRASALIVSGEFDIDCDWEGTTSPDVSPVPGNLPTRADVPLTQGLGMITLRQTDLYKSDPEGSKRISIAHVPEKETDGTRPDGLQLSLRMDSDGNVGDVVARRVRQESGSEWATRPGSRYRRLRSRGPSRTAIGDGDTPGVAALLHSLLEDSVDRNM